MFRILQARLQQGHRTMRYPDGPPPPLPDRFRGRLLMDRARCPDTCRACADACPTTALTFPTPTSPRLDLGRCLFCTDCVAACPNEALSHLRDPQLAARDREALVVDPTVPADRLEVAHAALSAELQRVFGRSLKLRQVSAGGCNACESDLNVLGTVGWDIGRFGIQFVASPRHADGLVLTGPIPDHMALAVQKTWAAIPGPKIAIAVGACAISGGPYAGHPEVHDGLPGFPSTGNVRTNDDASPLDEGHARGTGGASAIPIALHIPGCPPHPLTILDGFLRLLGRLPAR
jgi:Ni,Fe-hydrogenase III small subunit/NAD-dependent dihydropyrimidine dehydrogenase PreA subunit